jgi:hypothetical protein
MYKLNKESNKSNLDSSLDQSDMDNVRISEIKTLLKLEVKRKFFETHYLPKKINMC